MSSFIHSKKRLLKSTSYLLAIFLIACFAAAAFNINSASAATTFTVDVTSDGVDINNGDGICADSSGDCSLRAAIEEANALAGSDIIEFGLTGIGDFLIGGQDGYTIVLGGDSLPLMTSQITIDGYSQANSLANTAISPAPINARLLIEIDGTALSAVVPNQEACIRGGTGSEGSTIRGLVINNCGGDAINLYQVDDWIIQGNFIGTDPTGLIDEGNGRNNITTCVAAGIGMQASGFAQIGGITPQDRNIIAGNQCDDIYISIMSKIM